MPYLSLVWKKILEEIKRKTNLNTFKHNLKKHYLKELVNQVFKKKFC